MVNPLQIDNIQVRLRNLGRSYSEGKQQHKVLINVSADFLEGESNDLAAKHPALHPVHPAIGAPYQNAAWRQALVSCTSSHAQRQQLPQLL